MPKHRDITIHIVADGREPAEYDVKTHADKIVTTHILGQPGVEFAYEYRNQSTTGIVIQPILDGHKSKEVTHCGAGEDGYDNGPCTSRTSFRPYKFLKVPNPHKRRQRADYSLDDESQIGVLEFRVFRVTVTRFASHIIHEHDTEEIEANLGRSTRVSSDHPWKVPPKEWENIDREDNPYVVFRFLYHTEEQLQELTTTPTGAATTGRTPKVPPAGNWRKSNAAPPAKRTTRSKKAGASKLMPMRDQQLQASEPSVAPHGQEEGCPRAENPQSVSVPVIKSEFKHSLPAKARTPEVDSDSDSSDLERQLVIAEAQKRQAEADTRVMILKYEIEKKRRKRERRSSAVGPSDTAKRRRKNIDDIIDLTSD